MKIVSVPCSFDNYGYLIICEETGDAAVVDPAEFYPISSELERAGVKLRAIYCTHHHADHIGGLEDSSYIVRNAENRGLQFLSTPSLFSSIGVGYNFYDRYAFWHYRSYNC